MSAFAEAENESAIFYPFSIMKGYALTKVQTSEAVRSMTFEVRLYIFLLLLSGLASYFFQSNWALILLICSAVFCLVRYVVVVLAIITDKPIVKVRFKIKDSLHSSLRGHSYISLSFLVLATGYLGWAAWFEGLAQDTGIFRFLAAFCWVFALVHLSFIYWKRRLAQLDKPTKAI